MRLWQGYGPVKQLQESEELPSIIPFTKSSHLGLCQSSNLAVVPFYPSCSLCLAPSHPLNLNLNIIPFKRLGNYRLAICPRKA
jgi:hypothetical protein